MVLHSWLQNLLSALALGRGQRMHARRGSHRPNVDALEDRSLPAFIAPVDYTVGVGPYDVKVGDFNGDGTQDLATANFFSDNVSVLLGNPDGTFQPARNTSTPAPSSLAVGDFDRDGNLDVAAGHDRVSILLGRGDGTFVPTPEVSIWSDFLVTGDLNGDGKLDLVTMSVDYYGTSSISALIGHGDGTFTPHTFDQPYGPYFTRSVALADFDGDGNLDLLAAGESLLLLKGNGDGTFQQPNNEIGPVATSLAVADFDADGKLDLAWTNFSGSVSVMRGNGDGTFQPAQSFAAGTNPRQIHAADMNGDGVLDLVVEDLGSYQPYPIDLWVDPGLIVLLGAGDGSFGPPITTALASSRYAISAVDVADFNADGRPDAAVTQFSPSRASVLLNDGTWSPDDPASVSIRGASVTEGNTGTVNATFTVTLSRATNVDVTVQYATADITATAGSDYAAASGTVTIPAGQTTATVTVAVRGDRLPEPTETFAVNLTAATGASIVGGPGICTILDNEPRISISDVSKYEGRKGQKTTFTLTVTLSVAYDQAVTVSFQTVNGTATAGDNDYVAKAGTLTFAPGETTKTITIEVKGDSKREADEYFYLDLFGNSTNSLFIKSRGIGTIWNDD
jgi:hypothetical protein